MPKGSQELTNARKEEILNACAALYETMGFKEITICDIGKKTSFTRTSIYNYFQTKEEIFLGLFQREHELWAADLYAIAAEDAPLTAQAFAQRVAATLEKRGCMLKLMSMNLYDMEDNCRLENLVSFKKTYAQTLKAMTDCLSHCFPAMSEKEKQEILYAFFPFLQGVYPYTSHTQKQKAAMQIVGLTPPPCTVQSLVQSLLLKLLSDYA